MQEECPVADVPTLYEHYRICVDAKQQPHRIDSFLLNRLPYKSRNRIQKAIENSFVQVNKHTIKCSYKVKPGDCIQIIFPTPPPVSDNLPEDIPLDITFEDDVLLLVNKPAGMIVHPAHHHPSGTLINALLYHLSQGKKNKKAVPGLVHRIDMYTSGLLVVAKTEDAHTHLAKQFYDHSITRYYQAVIWGVPEASSGTIAVNLAPSPHDKRVIQPYLDAKTGKKAITHYRTLEHLGGGIASLVELQLETGRTHQIRAHMRHLGHPLIGDERYGGGIEYIKIHYAKRKDIAAKLSEKVAALGRQALHARHLSFQHPVTREEASFEVPIPLDLQNILQFLRNV